MLIWIGQSQSLIRFSLLRGVTLRIVDYIVFPKQRLAGYQLWRQLGSSGLGMTSILLGAREASMMNLHHV